MKYIVDTELLKKYDIDCIDLEILMKGYVDSFTCVRLPDLQRKNLVKITNLQNKVLPSFLLRAEGEKIVKLSEYIEYEKKQKDDNLSLGNSSVDAINFNSIDLWIEEYRKLFKVKDRYGNLVIGKMGDKRGCSAKMRTFSKEYPEYFDKDLICKAAQLYINEQKSSDYKFLQQADYFIYKNNTSRLAQYCETVSDNEEEIIKINSSNVIDF